MSNFSVGVIFLADQRAKLINSLQQMVGEFQLQKVNNKWECLMLDGQSIDDSAISERLLSISNNLPLMYYNLEESCFAYRIFNCGETIAAFEVSLSPFTGSDSVQLDHSNPSAFNLFALGSAEVTRLLQLFTPENLADEKGINDLILTFKAVLQLQGLGWKNGRCIAGNEVHPITVIKPGGTSETPWVQGGKADTSVLGDKPGFFKILVLIWRYPREVMRYVLETDYINWSPYLMMLLATLSAGIGFSFMPSFEPVSVPIWLKVLLMALVGVFSLIPFYLFGAMIKWTGKWIGGQGHAREIRAVFGWAGMAYGLLMMVFNVLQMLLLSKDYINFLTMASANMLMPDLLQSFILKMSFFLLAGLVLLVFGTIMFSKCLGEVQGFSALRAFANCVLAYVIFFGIIFSFVLIITFLFVVG